MSVNHLLKILYRQFWIVTALTLLAGFLGIPRYLLAIPLSIELVVMPLFYRCPHCNVPLDIRHSPKKHSHCPNCGAELPK